MATINAICFDADGVVISPQMQFAKHLAEEHAISSEMTRPFFHGIFNECLLGRAALRDVLPDYLQGFGSVAGLKDAVSGLLQSSHQATTNESIGLYQEQGVVRTDPHGQVSFGW